MINFQVGEMIHNFLKYTPNKFEHLYFLAGKSLLRDLYLDEILADELLCVKQRQIPLCLGEKIWEG